MTPTPIPVDLHASLAALRLCLGKESLDAFLAHALKSHLSPLQVLEQLVWHDRPASSERFHGSFKVDRVPEHDRCDDEVQPAGAEPLVVEGAILDHTAAVETHRPAQCVLGLALVQADLHPAASDDPLVKQTWDETRRLCAEVGEFLERLSPACTMRVTHPAANGCATKTRAAG